MGHPVHTKFHGGVSTFETSEKQSVSEQTAVNDSADGSYKGESFTQMLTEAEANVRLLSDLENPCEFRSVTEMPGFVSGHTAEEKRSQARARSGGLSNQGEDAETAPLQQIHQNSTQLHPTPNRSVQMHLIQDTIPQSSLPAQSISSPAQIETANSSSTARKSSSARVMPARRDSKAEAHAATLSDETSARHGPAIPDAPPVETNEKQAGSEAKQQVATAHHKSGHGVRSRKKSVRFSLATFEATVESATTAGTSEKVRPRSRAGVVTEEQTRKRRSSSIAERETMGTPPRAMKGQDMIEEISQAAEEAAKQGIGRVTRGDKRKQEVSVKVKDEGYISEAKQ